MLQGKAHYWPAVSYSVTSTQAKKKQHYSPSDSSLSFIKESDHQAERSRWVDSLREQKWVLLGGPDSCHARPENSLGTSGSPEVPPWRNGKRKRCCDDLMWGVDSEGMKTVNPKTCVREHREKAVPVRPDAGWALSTSASSVKLLKGLYLVYFWASEKHSISLMSVEMGW